MNHLIITTGNSDIQFYRPDIEQQKNISLIKEDDKLYVSIDGDKINIVQNRFQKDWLLLASCRKDGDLLKKHFASFEKIIHLPLIQPTLDYLKQYEILFSKVSIVYTDQKDEKFRKNDTLFIKDIIELKLKEQYPNIEVDFLGIEKVTDIDALYPIMYAKVRVWRNHLAENAQVYLADQGGIDQINQSLRLQLLQAFKTRIHILQKAEAADTKELQFPQLFLKDLARQNIIKHVNDYEFNKVDDTLQPENWVIRLSEYAARRLELQYEKIYQVAEQANAILKKENRLELPKWNWKKMRSENRLDTNKIIIRDLYLAAKIQFKNARYNEFIWRMFTIYENFLREPIDTILQTDSLHTAFNSQLNRYDTNKKWDQLLEKLDLTLKKLLCDNKIFTSNPNRASYSFIFYYLVNKNIISSPVQNEDLKSLEMELNELSGRRNGVMHKMGSVNKNDLGSYFSSPDAKGFQLLDQWFGIQGMGDFDLYREQILDYYQ
ncbi:MAG: hypothetical protein JST21_01425 [Bacteroidetes bacterium]|nr:hypothetical protein [Bacteroidota bacterium]